jgi:putative transposase
MSACAKSRMMLERGVAVSYETIRRWCNSPGSMITARLHRKSPSSSNVWHLDEAVVRIGGRKCWLWRAVDQDGSALDEIVQARRNTKAAKRLLVRLLKKQGLAPKPSSPTSCDPMAPPGVRSCPPSSIALIRPEQQAENSHLPFRRRERTRQGFRSIGSLQQFVSIFTAVRNHFVPAKSNRSPAQIRSFRQAATTQWRMAALQLA